MILSGAQSMIAGVAYFLGGLYDKRHIKDVGGYAIFGAYLLPHRRDIADPEALQAVNGGSELTATTHVVAAPA